MAHEYSPGHRPVGRRAVFTLAAGVLIALVGCKAPASGEAPSQSTAELKPAPAASPAPGEAPRAAAPLKVAFNQWVGFAGLFLAEERGLFKAEGLEVQLVPFSGPGDSIPPLLAEQIDVSLTTANNLALIAGKQPAAAKVVYVIDASDGADGIVASQAVPSVAALKGKKVAVTLGEINHMLLMLGLESAQLAESDVTLVDMSPDDAGAAFMAGKVDAAVTWEPWLTRAKEKGGNVIYSSKEPGAKDTLIDVMTVSDRALAERSRELAAFTRGLDAGLAFLREQPAEAKAIVARRLEAKPEDVDGMLSGARLYTRAENQALLTGSLQATFGRIEEFLKAHSLITRGIEPAQLVSAALVR